MSIIITSAIIIFTIIVLIVAYGVAKEKIKKNLVFILFTMIILIYFFVKPLVLHSAKYSISGNSIVRKATLCFPPLFKCSEYKKDIIMMTINPDTKNTTEGKVNFEITKDDKFNVLTNRKIIAELLKTTLNIEVPETNISVSEDLNKILLEITTGDCAIIDDITEGPCLRSGGSGKRKAEYKVTKPIPGKMSCIDLISSLSEDMKKGYQNWTYDGSKDIISGEKVCLDIDCALNSNIIESTCSPQTEKNYAYYTVTPNIGTGMTCTQVASRLTQRQKTTTSGALYDGNWYFDQTSNQVRSGDKTCIPNISCSIINDIPVDSSCDLNTTKITGTHNLNPSRGSGETCSALFERIKNSLNTSYSGWRYDATTNKFLGEKNCCVNTTQKFYNGQCYNTCPSNTYLSKNEKVCLTNCNLETGITVIDEENKKCLPACPDNKSFLDIDTNRCLINCPSGKFILNNKCYTTCPDGYYNNSNGNVCTQYSVEVQQELVNKKASISPVDRPCLNYDYSKISDTVNKIITDNGFVCGQGNQNGFNQTNYCMNEACKNIMINDDIFNYPNVALEKLILKTVYSDQNKIIFIDYYSTNSFNLFIYDILSKTLLRKTYDYTSLVGSVNMGSFNNFETKIINNVLYIVSPFWFRSILILINMENYTANYYILNKNTTLYTSIEHANILIKDNFVYIADKKNLIRFNTTDNTSRNYFNELNAFLQEAPIYANVYIYYINNNIYLFLNTSETTIRIIKFDENSLNNKFVEENKGINTELEEYGIFRVVYHASTNKLIISTDTDIRIYNTSSSNWLLEKNINTNYYIMSINTSEDTRYISLFINRVTQEGKTIVNLISSKDYGNTFIIREIPDNVFTNNMYISSNGQFQSHIINYDLKFKTNNLLTSDAVDNQFYQLIYTTDYGENFSLVNVPNKYKIYNDEGISCPINKPIFINGDCNPCSVNINENIYNNDGNCVSSCIYVIDDGFCKPACPSNKVNDGGFCKPACPSNKVNDGGICKTACPSNKINDNGICRELISADNHIPSDEFVSYGNWPYYAHDNDYNTSWIPSPIGLINSMWLVFVYNNPIIINGVKMKFNTGNNLSFDSQQILKIYKNIDENKMVTLRYDTPASQIVDINTLPSSDIIFTRSYSTSEEINLQEQLNLTGVNNIAIVLTKRTIVHEIQLY